MTCEAFELRLIAGEKPSDDAVLAEHVGSCLRCFRTAADIREVPRLRALLREYERGDAAFPSGEGAFDPGPDFWQKFPAQVGAAWARTQPGAVTVQVRSLGERLWGWLRQPVPAALTGAVCAMGVALLLFRPVLGPGGVAPAGGRAVAAGVAELELGLLLPGEMAGEMSGQISGAGTSADDSVDELDVEGLATLRDELDRALGSAQLPADPAAEIGAGDQDVASAAVSSDPATVAEDLEMLDEVGLLALRDGLGQRI